MGSTDSQPERVNIDRDYRLIRRFISEFYGSSEITVIENKITKEQLVLKQTILQINPQAIIQQLESRKILTHRNIIQLKSYYIQSDLGICSNLFKLHTLFQYQENTLEDYLNDNEALKWSDNEIHDFLKQLVVSLTFLERNQIVYLLSGPKNIVVVEQQAKNEYGMQTTEESKRPKHRVLGQRQRNSLSDLNGHKRTPSELSSQKRLTALPEIKNKRTYKLYEPLDVFTNTRSLYNIQSFMEVPMHPHLELTQQENQILTEPQIKQQNLFTVILIAFSLLQNCDIDEMDIYSKNGKISIQKLSNKIEELYPSYPRTCSQILKLLPLKGVQQYEYRSLHQNLKLKDFAFIIKRQDSKVFSRQNKENIKKTIMGNVERVVSKKRLSVLQI